MKRGSPAGMLSFERRCAKEGTTPQAWVRARHDGGATILGLYKETGVGRPTLTRWLKESGARPRTIHEDNVRRYNEWTLDQRRAIGERARARAGEIIARGESHLQRRNKTKYPGKREDHARACEVAYGLAGMLRVCHHCGMPWEVEVHHLNGKPWGNEPDNLLPLCASCHLALHAFAYKEHGIQKHAQLDAWFAPSKGEA